MPPAYTIQYPRDLAPLIGDKTLDESVALGVNAAVTRIQNDYAAGDRVYLVGVSQGAVVMAETKRAWITDPKHPIDPKQITVLTFGDPTNPDGGFLSKLDRWNIDIPGYTPVTHTPGAGYDGGEPGGSRHVGTTTTHYRDDDGNPVADPNTNRSVAEKPNRPVRNVVKQVGETIKKVADRLTPKTNRQ